MVDTNTDNRINFLQGNAFRVTFGKFPMLTFMLNEFEMPGLALGYREHPTPLLDFHTPGEKLTFDPLVVTFNIDEYFGAYIELWRWMMGLGFPRGTDEFKALEDGDVKSENGESLTLVSDMTLEIMSSKSRPILSIKFVDAFPINLAPFTFSLTQSEPMPIVTNATIAYSYFVIGDY